MEVSTYLHTTAEPARLQGSSWYWTELVLERDGCNLEPCRAAREHLYWDAAELPKGLSSQRIFSRDAIANSLLGGGLVGTAGDSFLYRSSRDLAGCGADVPGVG